MKNLFYFILFYCLFSNNFYGQQITINRIESRLITNQGVEFIGDLFNPNNDLYTFPNWSNNGIIFLDSKSYSLVNINFNVTRNSFESRISRDKLFSFKNSEIDSVSINNLIFKKFGNSFYEVLFEKGNIFFLKKHDITFQKGVENRLGVGTLGKTKNLVAYNYLIKSGDIFKRIELTKSSIVGLLNDANDKDELENFVKKEDLSYKKENDIIQIFKFLVENSNNIILI
ncbi:MAG: hypothetical protein HQ490_05420 [Lutibacter sp.]|nr:hypothetical protein [Lutibacter sp.]